MYVIAVLNQKGGSGKTTISTNLARSFQLAGNDTLLIDSDPQGSSMDWYAAHKDNPVEVDFIPKPILESKIRKIKKDFVIIDGAPQASDLAISAILASNLVIIPVTPSPYDIWASEDLINLVKQRIQITKGKLRAALVISRAIKNTKIGKEVVDILKGYELPILTARTHNRIIYSNSAMSGQTVFDEIPQGEASQEINAIMKECLDLLIK